MIDGVKQIIEGILIKKMPYQERHLIGHLLMRNGKQVSVLFYGGMGGGKKQKTTGLELGHMLQTELSYGRGQDFYRAKNWVPLWQHQKIRYHYKSFALLCFFLEVASTMSLHDNLHEETKDHDEGLFRVISNAIVHLENSLNSEREHIYEEIALFLGKLFYEQGIFPQLDLCCFTENPLKDLDELVLVSDQGGFATPSALPPEGTRKESDMQVGKQIWQLLRIVKDNPYQELKELGINNFSVASEMWDYLCFQMQWKRDQLRTWQALC